MKKAAASVTPAGTVSADPPTQPSPRRGEGRVGGSTDTLQQHLPAPSILYNFVSWWLRGKKGGCSVFANLRKFPCSHHQGTKSRRTIYNFVSWWLCGEKGGCNVFANLRKFPCSHHQGTKSRSMIYNFVSWWLCGKSEIRESTIQKEKL